MYLLANAFMRENGVYLVHVAKNHYLCSRNCRIKKHTLRMKFSSFFRITLAMIFMTTAARATAHPVCHTTNYNLRSGMPSNIVTSICQTGDHQMWFSTWNGLVCYDGYEFNVYGDADRQHRALSTNVLLHIGHNVNDDIWCTTYDLGAYLFQRGSGRFVPVSDIIRREFNDDFRCIRTHSLANGHTWLISYDKGHAWYCVDDSAQVSVRCIRPYGAAYGNVRGQSIANVEYTGGQEWLYTDSCIQSLTSGWASARPYHFICAAGGLFFMANAGGSLAYWHEGLGVEQVLDLPEAVHAVTSLGAVDDGRVAVGTDAGLLIMHTATLRPEFYPMATVERLFIDAQRCVWTYTADGHFTRTDPDTRTTLRFAGQAAPGERRDECKVIFVQDRYGTVWMASDRGQSYSCALGSDRLEPWSLDETGGCINRCYFVDDQGNLWSRGSSDLVKQDFGFRLFDARALANISNSRSMAYDREGNLWVGDIEGRLCRVAADGSVTSVTLPATVDVKRIYAICQDSRGRVWVGTKGDGLFCIGHDGTRRFRHDAADAYSLPSDQIYAVCEDRRHRIWVGTFERGLCLVDERPSGETRFLHSGNEMTGYPTEKGTKIRRIAQTDDGTMLISSSNGFVTFADRFDRVGDIRFHVNLAVEGDSRSLYTSDVMCAVAGDDGYVYVATRGGGLQRVADSDLLADAPLFEDVPALSTDVGTILAMVADGLGNLWIGCENTIIKFTPRTGCARRFGAAHLGDDTEMTESQCAMDPATGSVAFATRTGYVQFFPARIDYEADVPPLMFKDIRYYGQDGATQRIVGHRITVPADRRSFSLSFPAIRYADNSMVRYAWRMTDGDGGSDRWMDLGSNHTMTFSILPAGRHTLEVKCTDVFGAWPADDHAVRLDVEVEPTFVETVWAKVLALLLIAAAVALAIYIILLHMRVGMEHRMNCMKTDFFNDISHKLRTPLMLISSPLAEVMHHENLSDDSRQLLEMVNRNARQMLALVNHMLKFNDPDIYISDENAAQVSADEERMRSVIGQHHSNAHDAADGPPPLKILVVEDNADLRAFLYSILSGTYQVLLAENGQQGLDMTRSEQPDFVLTDVMMPVMDGLQMVHQIKQDSEVSHIPIIVLSAKASLNDRIEGLKEGINDYITKPFSATYLMQRMENIILNQRMLQQRSMLQLTESGEEGGSEEAMRSLLAANQNLSDIDRDILRHVIVFINAHLNESSLKINDIADHVHLGRTVFYNKIKALTGKSPLELLVHLRMERAERLITQTDEQIAQIAYSVGFSDVRYFGRIFKQCFGMTPTEYRAEKARASE